MPEFVLVSMVADLYEQMFMKTTQAAYAVERFIADSRMKAFIERTSSHVFADG
jgi:hypothetical protein